VSAQPLFNPITQPDHDNPKGRKLMRTAHRLSARIVLAALLLAAALPVLTAGGARAAETSKGKVNLNSADASQLALLPRVGPSLAQKILDFRKQNGAFKSAEDLMLVRGVGEKTFQLLKPYIAISGETTLREKVKAGRSGSSGSGAGKDASRAKEGSR
jgi:competence ComEA-like helix-hairpin-helix protein